MHTQGALFCGAYTEAPKLWEEHLKQTLGIFLWGTWRLMREQWRLPDEGERLLDAFLGWWPALREHAAKAWAPQNLRCVRVALSAHTYIPYLLQQQVWATICDACRWL